MENESPQLQPIVINAPITVVWVYKADQAVSNEIAVSINSVRAHLSNVHNLLICGDEAQGLPLIPSPPVKRGRFAKWIDSSVKLQAIIDDPRVTDDFLWMYDDTFVLSPLDAHDIHPPRYDNYLTRINPLTTWRGVANITAEAFSPCLNFSSHYPMIYNKELLQKTMDKFQTHTRPWLIETLYGNDNLHLNPQPLPSWFKYIRTPHRSKKPGSDIKLINVGTFNTEAQRWFYT